MNRTANAIEAKFAELRAAGRTALIPFLTIGDPTVDMSIRILGELERAGADIVELGVPYSDPLADGPVIQRASERALKSRITVADVIAAAGAARRQGIRTPFILFTYYNPVLQLGFDRLFDLLRANDISGLIIPDLPMEEDAEMKALADEHGVSLIPLVAPTSKERIARIVGRASGFVYCVSSLGVTGVRSDFHQGIDDFLHTVRAATQLPIAVGFGISNREQVERFSAQCDGVVVGSAIVRQIEEALPLLASEATAEQGLLQIRAFVAQLKGNSR